MDFAGFGGEGGGVEDCFGAVAAVVEGHFGEAELGGYAVSGNSFTVLIRRIADPEEYGTRQCLAILGYHRAVLWEDYTSIGLTSKHIAAPIFPNGVSNGGKNSLPASTVLL